MTSTTTSIPATSTPDSTSDSTFDSTTDSTTLATPERTTAATTSAPEQLTLLPETTVPVQFRLDEDTRRRGLHHIAEIRARLERASPSKPPGRVRRSAA